MSVNNICIKKSVVVGILAAFFFSVTISEVFAHAAGASFEYETNGYLIDIGYDPEIIISGKSVRFDFDIFPINTNETAAYTDIGVRITKEDTAVYAGNQKAPEYGFASMTYVFPKGGSYDLTVRYINNGQSIAEHTFTVPVESGGGSDSPWVPISAGLLGLMIGFAMSLVIKRP